MREIQGNLVVLPDQRFGIVVARFNSAITERLLAGAVDAFTRHGVDEGRIIAVHVPGSFEIPTAATAMAEHGQFSAIVCLGCVIRGETGHYDHVAGQVAGGVGAIGPKTGVPVLFGVITADTVEQAMDRAGLKMGNAGWNAACAAIEMANVMTKIAALKDGSNGVPSVGAGRLD